MKKITQSFLGLILLLGVAACADTSESPLDLASTEALMVRGGDACAAATAVASTEAELNAALAAATPGDVIGIEGKIGLNEWVWVETAGVTLTCASPDAGLYLNPGSPSWTVLGVTAPDVTVRGIEIDGTGHTWALYAGSGGSSDATGFRLEGSRIVCGWNCAFLVGATDAVVTGNAFVGIAPGTGLHVQGGMGYRTDRTHVSRNTFTATGQVGFPTPFGAIRVRDGEELVIVDNVVSGGWRNGIAVATLSGVAVERNTVEGVVDHGIHLGANAPFGANTFSGLFRANRVTASGKAGVLVRAACANAFIGNRLSGNGGGVAAFLDTNSGANGFAGNNDGVVDQGSFDCDGDGVTDPNRITGTKSVRGGGPWAALADDFSFAGGNGPAPR